MESRTPGIGPDYVTCSVPPECVDALHGCYLYFNMHHFYWQMTSEESMQKVAFRLRMHAIWKIQNSEVYLKLHILQLCLHSLLYACCQSEPWNSML